MPTNPSTYPNLENVWQKNLPQIDQQISSFCDSCAGEPTQQLPDLQNKVTGWITQQNLDTQTQNELAKSKQDPSFWEDKLSERLDFLKRQGKIKPAAQQGGMQAGAAGSSSAGSNRVNTTSANQTTTQGQNKSSGR